MSNINPLKEEEGRLSALYSYHILDTAREDDFDQLTELAAAICQTPVALISLVDGERQWFKSSFGTDVEETDRCYSFCTYAIQDNDVMQVEDSLEDQRFYNNPLVTGLPNIRFYAGMPLIDADGYALGSICVIDHKSRTLSEIQTKALRTLANQVVDKLALRKKVYELEISKKALESSENALKIANEKLAEGYLLQKGDNDELQITNRKLEETQYSLKDTQLKLNIAIESAGLGLFTIGLDSDADVIVNDQFAEMFGLSNGYNVNLQQIYDLVEPHYIPLIKDKIQKGVENGKTVDLLYKIKNQTTGEARWIKGLGKVQLGRDGKADSFIGINIDVTEEMEAIFNAEQLNSELRNKEIKLQNILDTVGEGIGITDENGNIVYTNQRNREIFKFDEKSMLKLSNSSNVWNNRRLDGSPMPVEEHPITKAIHTGEKVTGQEFMVQDGDGISKYLKMNTTPIKDSDGTITGAIGSFADITESYLLHEDLKQKEEKMRMAVASANLGTWHIDVETRTFIPSQRLKDLFGFHSDEDMTYEAAVTQIADSHRTSVVEAVEEAIKSGEAYELDYPIVGYHDKKIRWVRATGKLYTNPVNTHLSHFSGTMADITEKKLDEQRRSDFIGMVSHDLRNPLTAIGGYNYILGRRAKKIDDDLILSSVAKISDQVKRMESMIEGFLEIARYGEGKIHLQKTNFDISGLMRSAEDDLIGITNSHQIIFEPSKEINILADRNKLEQVIINFVNNAVKYSDPDTTIKVTCEEKESRVLVTVEDQGMGIPPKDQSFIFDRFYRVESDSMKNIKGFGMGLYICKEIIESHQGQIGVDSIKGKGSKFWFAIPV